MKTYQSIFCKAKVLLIFVLLFLQSSFTLIKGVEVNVLILPPNPPVVNFNPNMYCVGDIINPPTAKGSDLQWYRDIALTDRIITMDPLAPTNDELGFESTVAVNRFVYVT